MLCLSDAARRMQGCRGLLLCVKIMAAGPRKIVQVLDYRPCPDAADISHYLLIAPHNFEEPSWGQGCVMVDNLRLPSVWGYISGKVIRPSHRDPPNVRYLSL